ncbi:hypothetical protein QQ045_001542 [Rhodiola kirilowii]
MDRMRIRSSVMELSSVEALDCDYEPEADSCITVSGDEELIAVSDSELHQDNSVTDRYDFDISVPANGLAFLPSQAKRGLNCWSQVSRKLKLTRKLCFPLWRQ